MGLCLYYCDVERDCPQADGDEPAGDCATSHDSVHDVLVNKKSNAMLVFILFSTKENLVSFLCCCFTKVFPSHFPVSKDVPSVSVHFVGSGQVLWTCTGRNKMLPPPTSLPVMDEIAGVNTASLGGNLHSSKKRARSVEGLHDKLNGHVFNLERDGLRQVVLCP